MQLAIENIILLLGMDVEKEAYRNKFRPKSVDRTFARSIKRFRGLYSDEELRRRYRQALEYKPDLSWVEFIVQAAIAEP